MRVSLNWLKEYVDLPTTDPVELARAFDMLGHAVEEVETFDVAWTDVVIGKVLRIEPHPNADNVRVTHVDIGDGAEHQIICGAWNFDVGAVVPVSIPGAILPGDFKIGARTIRGVESFGMICSERELGLGELHEGIMVLDDDAPIGEPFEAILDLPDVVFDLEITNNRPDVMGMVGVARELAAWFDVPMHYPDVSLTSVPGSPALDVSISAVDGCNRFVARELRDVTIGPSPLWMTERLRKAGIRAISNIVDVSNYVMLEMGHPMHAFDADAIAGESLDVRWAEEGEELETLDGVVRGLGSADLVIVDTAGPTSLAAVMGGARSEVRETTHRVIMEAASWDPPTVMYTSRRHDLRSEASARFERGVDPNLAPDANARACKLLLEIAGGTVLEEVIDVVANATAPAVIELKLSDITRILGDRFTLDTSAALLGRLLLDVEVRAEALTVTVPTNRPDLTRPADLVEEIARLADFDTFDATVPTGPAGGLLVEQSRERLIRSLLRGMGLVQTINLPFVSEDELAAFNGTEVETPEVVTVRNPLRDDQSKLRQSLLPALLRRLRENRNRGVDSVALFETGRVFYARPWGDDGRVPDQPMRLGIAIVGPFGHAAINSGTDDADATTALAIVDSLVSGLGLSIRRRSVAGAGFHPTRSAAVMVGDQQIGFAGELHPDLSDAFELNARVAIVEVDMAALVSGLPSVQMEPISTYPHVDFDLSFEVGLSDAAGDIVSRTVAVSELVEAATVFDDYRDPEAELRAVAVSYRLRAPDRTMTAEEISAIRQEMIDEAEAAGAKLRGGA